MGTNHVCRQKEENSQRNESDQRPVTTGNGRQGEPGETVARRGERTYREKLSPVHRALPGAGLFQTRWTSVEEPVATPAHLV